MNFEDKLEFSKILEAIKANFNDKYKEYRKKWGGGIMGSKSQAKTKANERVLAKEAAERINYLCSLDKPMKDDKAAQLLGNVYGVLDLQLLLSASNDKTIRSWRIGCDQCLHIFHHKHYGNQ